MKKVMIGILILVPILIVLIIAMVSTILTAAAYISVEKINLDYNDGYSNPLTLNLSDEVYNLNKFFNVSVEPAKATDKDYVWKIEGLQCFDTDYQKRYDEYVTAYAEYVAYREAHKNDVGFVDNGFKGDVVAPAAMLVAVDEDGNYVKDALGNYVEVSESKVGRLRINSYCAFDIVVVLQNFSARANIYVTGFDVTAATIAGKDNIKVGESALLTAQAQPVDSIIKKIIWQSSNEAVATVDKNGVVKGLTAGTATITAKLKKYDATTDEDKDYVVSSAFTLTVGASVSRYGASYTTHLSELSASELALVDPTATTNCTISGDTITLTGGTATIQTESGLFTIYRCGENDIVISDVEVFGFDSQKKHNFVLSVGDLPLLLNARYKSMDKVGSPTVTWSTSAKEVATVDGGTITGVGSGRVEITAKTATETATIDLLVQKKISMVILGTTNEKLAVGIARQTVYGSRVFADTSLTSKFDKKVNNKIAIDFVLPVAPLPTASAEEKAIFYSAFTFAVTGEDKKPSDLAYFERYSNVLVFDADKIAATGIKSRIKLTVTVTAKYPKYESTTSYTVKTVDIYVVDGVHITSDATDAQLKEPTMKIVDKMVDGKKVQTVVVDEDERIEFQKYNMPLYNQLFALAKEGNDMRNANIDAYNNGNMYFPAITLGKNIRWPDKGEESINWYVYSRLELFGDLYGNNMRIAAGFREIASSIDLVAVRDTADNLISNVTLRANTIPNGYEMTSSDKDSSNNLTAYSLNYDRYDNNRYRSVRNRIEYSILENNRSCIGIRSADVTVDGCIMRNTTQAAIFIPTEINDLNDDKGTADTSDDTIVSIAMYAHLTLNNCVMSNMIGTAMSVCYQHYSTLAGKTYPDGEHKGQFIKRDDVQQFLDRGETTIVKQTGFLDVYNWQPSDNLNMIDTGVPFLNDGLKQIIAGAMTSDDYKPYLIRKDGAPFAHLGFVTMGLQGMFFEPTYLLGKFISFEDKRFKQISSDLFFNSGALGQIVKQYLGDNKAYLYSYDNTVTDITPSTPYPYANSTKLFNKLLGIYS